MIYEKEIRGLAEALKKQTQSAKKIGLGRQLEDACNSGSLKAVTGMLDMLPDEPQAVELFHKLNSEKGVPAAETQQELSSVESGTPGTVLNLISPEEAKAEMKTQQATAAVKGRDENMPELPFNTPRVMLLEQITIDDEFLHLIGRNAELQEGLNKQIRRHGYRFDKPVIVWLRNGKYILIEGHHRFSAALAAGIKEIPLIIMEFPNRAEAIDFAIQEQVLRRNLSMNEMMNLTERIYTQETEKAKKRQGIGSIDPDAEAGKASEITGKKLHMSPTMIQRIMRVLRSEDQELITGVRNGDISVSAATASLAKLAKENKEPSPETEKETKAPAAPVPEKIQEEVSEKVPKKEKGAGTDDKDALVEDSEDDKGNDPVTIPVNKLIELLQSIPEDINLKIPKFWHEELLEFKNRANSAEAA
jgi:ParB-like chromosome segregation protein Spo0J